jgi:hypothetical protein
MCLPGLRPAGFPVGGGLFESVDEPDVLISESEIFPSVASSLSLSSSRSSRDDFLPNNEHNGHLHHDALNLQERCEPYRIEGTSD